MSDYLSHATDNPEQRHGAGSELAPAEPETAQPEPAGPETAEPETAEPEPADLTYDLAHEPTRPDGPDAASLQLPDPAVMVQVGTRTGDYDGDYSYDLAHDVPHPTHP